VESPVAEVGFSPRRAAVYSAVTIKKSLFQGSPVIGLMVSLIVSMDILEKQADTKRFLISD
jgi:hypothetical protein